MTEARDDRQRVSLRSLLSDTVIFGIGGVFDRLIGFLLLPITARLLGTDSLNTSVICCAPAGEWETLLP